MPQRFAAHPMRALDNPDRCYSGVEASAPHAVDVLVLGGGPAGAATALALAQHRPQLSVAVVERGGYGGDTVGETLPPHAAPLLRRLGVWEDFRRQGFSASAGTAAAWGDAAPHVNDYVFGAAGPGWHLDRAAFDRWLAAEAAARGAALHLGAHLAEAGRTGDAWKVWVRSAEGSIADEGLGTGDWGLGREDRVSAPPPSPTPNPGLRITARFVVDATGRAAAFARRQGAERVRDDGLVGLYRFFRGPAEAAHALVETTPQGWWYTAALPGDRAVAAFMTDADLARAHGLRDPGRWDAHLAEAPLTRARLEGLAPEGPPRTAAAHTQMLRPCVGTNWLAVGDAAMAVDPLSSLGLLKALRSGVLAAYAIGDHLAGEPRALGQYAALTANEHRNYLGKRAAYYRQEARWPDAPFWSRRRAEADAVPA